MRPLGISTTTRHPSFPDIPPLDEAGVPGFEAVSWQAMAAPARRRGQFSTSSTPRLPPAGGCRRSRRGALEFGFLPLQNRSVEELKEFVKSEIVRWGKVVRQGRNRGIAVAIEQEQ